MFIINWLKKKLGFHVCEEFTQWAIVTKECSRVPSSFSDRTHVMLRQTPWNQVDDGLIHYTRTWQQRKCTLCGKWQREDL